MAFLSWWELLILEQRLYHGPFGKYNRYRCWCLKRNARTTIGIGRDGYHFFVPVGAISPVAA